MIDAARNNSGIPGSQAAIAVKVLFASVVLVAAALTLSAWVTIAPTHWSLAGLGSSIGAFTLASPARGTAAPLLGRKFVHIMRGLAIGVAIAFAVLALTVIFVLSAAAFDSLFGS